MYSALVAAWLLVVQSPPSVSAEQCVHLRIELPGLKLYDIGTNQGQRSAAIQVKDGDVYRTFGLSLVIDADGHLEVRVREGDQPGSVTVDRFVLGIGEAPRATATSPSFDLSFVGTYSAKRFGSPCAVQPSNP